MMAPLRSLPLVALCSLLNAAQVAAQPAAYLLRGKVQARQHSLGFHPWHRAAAPAKQDIPCLVSDLRTRHRSLESLQI